MAALAMSTSTSNNASLTDRAMLIGLNIRQWSAAKNDKRVDKEVSDSHGSDITMGRFNKSLIAKEALAKLQKISSAARVEHYARTLPWGDDGFRILTSAGYFDYCESMARYKSDWDAALKHFLQAYPRYVYEAQQRLNGLFNPSEYPDASKIERKFAFSSTVRPLPDSGDFRVKLSDEETARIKRDMQSDLQESIDAAMSDVWTRLKSVVERMSERLKAFGYTSDGKVESPFRDSLVSNITELLDLIPSLNLTGDVKLTAFAAEIRSHLTSYAPEELREQDTARKLTINKADDILARMGDFI